MIIFVYQRPNLAWEFVQAREKVEGRKILPKHFVEQYFGSQNVIEEIKKKYGKRIRIDLLIKDNDGGTRTYQSNVGSLKPYLKPVFTLSDVQEIVGISDNTVLP
jgi:UDP-N-acetylglucosamine kinase